MPIISILELSLLSVHPHARQLVVTKNLGHEVKHKTKGTIPRSAPEQYVD